MTARRKKEKELISSAFNNPENFYSLIVLETVELKSKYKKIYSVMKKYYEKNKTFMTITDLAIEMNREKNKKYMKLLNEDLTDEKIKNMSIDEIEGEVEQFCKVGNIDNSVKVKKDIKKLREENRKEKFKREFNYLHKQAISNRKLGTSEFTIEKIQKHLLHVDYEKQIEKENKSRVEKAKQRLENLDKDVNVLPTGYNNLDNLLGGGFLNGTLATISGNTSIGKTQFAVNIFYNEFVQNNNKPLFLFLEGQNDTLWERLTVLHSQRSSELYPLKSSVKTREGLKELKQREKGNEYVQATESLEKTEIDDYLIDLTEEKLRGEKGLKILETTIEKELYNSPDIDSIIVDHLHELTPKRNQNIYYKKVVKTLKSIASKHDVAIIGLAQLNRNMRVRENKIPKLSDIRGSGGIEEVSDYVLVLHREDYQSTRLSVEDQRKMNNDTIEAHLLKHRQGDTGKVEFHFDKSRGIIDPQISGPAAKKIINENPELQKELDQKDKRNVKEQEKSTKNKENDDILLHID